jgi:hypothetical protein
MYTRTSWPTNQIPLYTRSHGKYRIWTKLCLNDLYRFYKCGSFTNTRLAPTVEPATPIAVGCKTEVYREHTGVPWNRRSFLSPTGLIEEKL